MIELDKQYRSSWDVRSLAHVVGLGRTTVAKILREARGARPRPARPSHERRTRFLRRDVMWSSDFMAVHGVKLLKTLDEMSRMKLAWNLAPTETAEAVVKHAKDLITRTGHKPLIWKYDHGPAFTSREFQAFLAENGIVPYPIPPRAPWANGRTERDNREVRNWLIPLENRQLTEKELEADIDEGMMMLNFVKPRSVLGYRTSASLYFGMPTVDERDREDFSARLAELKNQFHGPSWRQRLHRKAVRELLQKWGLYAEWERSENVKRLEACYVPS